jgi:hypothetical protein
MHCRIIIPSRQRADTLTQKALRLFPDATICVHKREAAAYRRVVPADQLLLHNVEGLGIIRQWILDHVPDEVVVMADDDISMLYSLAGVRARRLDDPLAARQLLETTAACAKAAGARIFGFNQGDIRKFLPQKPFSFNTWVGGLIGIIGRELRYDPRLRLHDDVDLCLQSLLQHRILWQDQRFLFSHVRFTGAGGNAASRSQAQHDEEIAYLRRKWGAHLTIQPTKTTVRLVLHVDRSRA